MSDLNSNSLSEAQQYATQQCAQQIKETIDKKGEIGFDEYMQIALHDPKVGYYQRQDEIFGKKGDFTTVPETSVHLAYCLAHACAKLIHDDGERVILEIGAGDGKLVCDILKNLASWKILPNRYYIYETSVALRVKQRHLLEQELPDYVDKVEWLADLSTQLNTVIVIANEVLDALPVKCFEVQAQSIHERYVGLDDQSNFRWVLQRTSCTTGYCIG